MYTTLKIALKGSMTINNVPSSMRCIHQYRNIIPWKTIGELSKHLINSVIYNDNGLLVLNKPYGVTFSREGGFEKNSHEESTTPNPEVTVFKKKTKDQPKVINSMYHTSGFVNDNLNLVDCLPYLKEHFGFNKLYLARVPEKFASGVAILTTSEELIESVNRCRLHSPTGKDRYLAITVGVPRHAEGKIKLGFKLETDSKKGKRVVMLRKWSQKAYKRGEVRIGTFHHRHICSGLNNLTSLVEICVELRKYHAYRLFAADYLLSPVLGDNLFGSRVQTVMDVPVTVHHFSDVADSPQKLPKEIYYLLGLTSDQASVIPVHFHLSEMLLPRFFNGRESLLLQAPPPIHFKWACEKLGIVRSELARIEAV